METVGFHCTQWGALSVPPLLAISPRDLFPQHSPEPMDMCFPPHPYSLLMFTDSGLLCNLASTFSSPLEG